MNRRRAIKRLATGVPGLFFSSKVRGQDLRIFLPEYAMGRSVRIGIQHTENEVAIWKARVAYSGSPYYSDYVNFIFSQSNTAVSNSWVGNTTSICWHLSGLGVPSRTLHREVTSRAFVWLTTRDATKRQAVRDMLIAQSQMLGTDFSNTTKWCPADTVGDLDIEIMAWLRRICLAYSFIRDSCSQVDRNTLDLWFRNAGYYFETQLHNGIADEFPLRKSNDYITCVGSSCPGTNSGLLHFGGAQATLFSRGWVNIRCLNAALLAYIGGLLNDKFLLGEASRFFKEWLIFATTSSTTDNNHCAIVDKYRWNTSPFHPARGYLYMGVAIGSMVQVADVVGRTGDQSLWNFETTDGRYGYEGTVRKSLKGVCRAMARMTLGTSLTYASNSSTTDPTLVINRFNNGSGGTTEQVEHWYMSPAANYYCTSEIKAAVETNNTLSPATGGIQPAQGDWNTGVGIRFQFAQTERQVRPWDI